MRTYDNINIGDEEVLVQPITDELVRQFAEISGDKNPLHLDEEFAKTTQFKARIAHGALLISFISTALYNFAGQGAIALSQDVKFLRPIYIGDTMTLTAKVVAKEMRRGQGVVRLEIKCKNPKGKDAITGVSEIIAPQEKN
ncbi:hypothetical protein BKI52_09815 [marine bacterium AO1-C]|nr:hypothetical protein BKI52_09815 [marine bacterium AO1-C]